MHSSKVSIKLKAIGLLALGVGLFGSVSLAWAQTAQDESPMKPLGAVFNQSERVLISQVRLVMFRPQTSSEMAGVSRINVNGAYHTSLMAGAYSVLCLVPGLVNLDVRSVVPQQQASQQPDLSTQIQLNAGQTVYLSVIAQGNTRYSLRPVEAVSAREALKAMREQIHALSRVPASQECKDPDIVTAPAPSAAANPPATSR
jgi:OOP family OmpA-OmpF porin